MEHVSWLLGEAWEHRRRRQRAIVGVALATCAAVALIYALAGPRSTRGMTAGIGEPANTIAAPPSRVFSQPPYMGVRCPVANSIACDRIGLAIWLKRPAYSVTASINGRPLALNRFGDQLISSARPRTQFDGYLRPAGLRSTMHVSPIRGTSTWLGNSTPFASLWLLIDYGSGRHVVTHARVPLMAGWG